MLHIKDMRFINQMVNGQQAMGGGSLRRDHKFGTPLFTNNAWVPLQLHCPRWAFHCPCNIKQWVSPASLALRTTWTARWTWRSRWHTEWGGCSPPPWSEPHSPCAGSSSLLLLPGCSAPRRSWPPDQSQGRSRWLLQETFLPEKDQNQIQCTIVQKFMVKYTHLQKSINKCSITDAGNLSYLAATSLVDSSLHDDPRLVLVEARPPWNCSVHLFHASHLPTPCHSLIGSPGKGEQMIHINIRREKINWILLNVIIWY